MPGRIEDYAIVGDLQTAALAGADGSVDSLCFPRFDSPACFAALLGDDTHGRWRIAPRRADAARADATGGTHSSWRMATTPSGGPSPSRTAPGRLTPARCSSRVGFLPYDDENQALARGQST